MLPPHAAATLAQDDTTARLAEERCPAPPREEPLALSKHVLIVDDEARIRDVVSYALQKEGYRVTATGDGRAALEVLEGPDKGGVDLVVLDVMLPEIDGLEVCRRVRAKSRVPILFLSARSEEIDRVLGLELGGDDYLTKPFSPRELVARARAIFRRVDDPEKAVSMTRANHSSSPFGPRMVNGFRRFEKNCASSMKYGRPPK